ncbi:hypothetical protein [Bacillus sp. S10(2024)]|uniref:hypothetical protein n=1 Tax=Bacillus sp. S10(2024) TaxID=3162886 RepID=UPI003D20E26B
MEGSWKLTKEQQLQILNNPDNFIGLTKSANTSKGSKSFEEWTMHKGKKIQVNSEFRGKMIVLEKKLEIDIQKQIDEFVKLNERR